MQSLAGTVTKTVTSEKHEGEETSVVVDSLVRPTGVEPVTPRSVVPTERIITENEQE